MIAFIPGLCPFDDILMWILAFLFPALYIRLRRKFKMCLKPCDCDCHDKNVYVIAKRVRSKDYYLRFCSSTGEPLWEDHVTPDTEVYSSKKSATNEIGNYILDGVMNDCRAHPIPKTDLPIHRTENTQTFYGIKQ